MTYKTLAELKAAYEDDTLDLEGDGAYLILDNDEIFAHRISTDQTVFRMHPHALLRQALDLLGIPWDEA